MNSITTICTIYRNAPCSWGYMVPFSTRRTPLHIRPLRGTYSRSITCRQFRHIQLWHPTGPLEPSNNGPHGLRMHNHFLFSTSKFIFLEICTCFIMVTFLNTKYGAQVLGKVEHHHKLNNTTQHDQPLKELELNNCGKLKSHNSPLKNYKIQQRFTIPCTK